LGDIRDNVQSKYWGDVFPLSHMDRRPCVQDCSVRYAISEEAVKAMLCSRRVIELAERVVTKARIPPVSRTEKMANMKAKNCKAHSTVHSWYTLTSKGSGRVKEKKSKVRLYYSAL